MLNSFLWAYSLWDFRYKLNASWALSYKYILSNHHSLIQMQGLVLICLCPFNIIYRSSRFFLIRSLFHCICAPFYKVIDSTRLEFYICWTTSYVDILNLQVKMVDFFLADQLTSQVSYLIGPSIGDMDLVFLYFWISDLFSTSAWPQTQAIRSFVYYICYYGWGKALSPGRKMCHVSDVYVIFYYISAAIPFWIRFLQVLNTSPKLTCTLAYISACTQWTKLMYSVCDD